MKKFLAILLSVALVLSLAACDSGNEKEETEETKADNTVTGMNSLSNREISEISQNLETFMSENEEAAEKFDEEYSELMGNLEYIDENGLTDQGITELKMIFIDIYSEYCSAEEVDLYAEFIFATYKYERAMSVYEAEISEYINNNYDSADSDDFKDGYIDLMCSYDVPEWYVRWMCAELFGDGGDVPENDNKNACVANQRVLVSYLTSHLQGVAITGYTEIKIEYDGNNTNITIDGDAISYEQFIALYDEIPYCPAQGTIVVGVSMDYNGNVDVECVCRDNYDGADHSL